VSTKLGALPALALALGVACRTLPRGGHPAGARLRADSARYTVRFDGAHYRAAIGYRYENRTAAPVSMTHCHAPRPPALEREVAPGRWVALYDPMLLMCRSVPHFTVPAGGTYRGVVDLLVAPRGAHAGPRLAVDSVAGTYRLRWVLRAGPDPDDQRAGLVEAISPSFRLIVRDDSR
jgi:hypothetical protein